jgi:hypothetical protein
MGEHVGFAFEALEVPQGVIFAGVGLDDFHAVMPTCGTGVFHAL